MDPFQTALEELRTSLVGLDLTDVARATDLVAGAGRIVLYAVGREKLQLMAFAMRLHHLGLRVAMHGDMAEPPIGAGDLFICSAGSADHGTTTALISAAAGAGADVVLLTARRDTALAAFATCRITLPVAGADSARMEDVVAPNGANPAVLGPGALYEATMLILFEVMALELRQRLGILPQTMAARHSNLT